MPRNTTRQGQSQGQGRLPRARVGAGDYVPAAAPNPYARMRYLLAVGRCVPQAFDALVTLADDSQFAAWAERWGFRDGWALDFARRHAPLWRENPETTGKAMIGSVFSFEPVFKAGPSWNPIAESESAYRARVEAYISNTKQTPGIAPTPERQVTDDHFEWLALHHVARQTYRQIAERYQDEDGNPSEAAIGRAITDVAALAAVTLRPARGRKSTQPHRS